MAFDPDAYLAESATQFDPDAYLKGTLPTLQERPKTFVEKVSQGVQNVAKYPLGLPISPQDVASGKAVHELDPFRSKPVQFLEEAGERVKGASTEAIGEHLRTTPSRFPVVRGAVAGAVDTGLSLLPFKPSEFAAFGAAPFMKLPSRQLRSPKVAEGGIGGELAKLGDDISPEVAGGRVKSIYGERVGGDVAKQLEPPRPLTPFQEPAPPRFPVPEEQFAPKVKGVSARFGAEPQTFESFGKTVKTASQRKTRELQGKEKSAWKNISEKHSEAPVEMGGTKSFLDEFNVKQGITEDATALAQLKLRNPTMYETALKSPNPEVTAQSIIKTNQAEFGGGIEKTGLPPRGGGEFNIIKRASQIANLPKRTLGMIRSFRSEVGEMIDWKTRGGEMNFYLKKLYRNLGDDIVKSAKKGGFEEDLSVANKTTKDFYSHIEKATSEVISGADFPEDITRKLIKSDSPSRIRELFNEQGMTEGEKNVARKAVIDRIADKSGGDPNKFTTELNKYSNDVKKELFGKDFEAVESLSKIGKQIDDEILTLKQAYKDKSKRLKTEYGINLEKVKAGQKKIGDILSENEVTLNKIMSDSESSELINNLVKNGTPEIAKATVKALGKDGTNLVRRGIINKVINKAKLKTGKTDKLTVKDIESELGKMNPEFITEIFGNDAKMINGIRDASKLFGKLTDEGRSQFPLEETAAGAGVGFAVGGAPGAGIGAVIGRTLPILKNVFTRYRISPKIYQMLERTQGAEIAGKIVPKQTRPAIVNRVRTPFNREKNRTPSGIEYEIVK